MDILYLNYTATNLKPMKRALILISLSSLLFSCKKDEEGPIIVDEYQTTLIAYKKLLGQPDTVSDWFYVRSNSAIIATVDKPVMIEEVKTSENKKYLVRTWRTTDVHYYVLHLKNDYGLIDYEVRNK